MLAYIRVREQDGHMPRVYITPLTFQPKLRSPHPLGWRWSWHPRNWRLDRWGAKTGGVDTLMVLQRIGVLAARLGEGVREGMKMAKRVAYIRVGLGELRPYVKLVKKKNRYVVSRGLYDISEKKHVASDSDHMDTCERAMVGFRRWVNEAMQFAHDHAIWRDEHYPVGVE